MDMLSLPLAITDEKNDVDVTDAATGALLGFVKSSGQALLRRRLETVSVGEGKEER